LNNKINQASLNAAKINLRLGFLDEALLSLEEALRLAQNNSDEMSINHCLIYLYKIAGITGNHREEMELAEQAISHSMKINNSLLMLYSCMSYALFDLIYDTDETKKDEKQRARVISWIDGLHYSVKKLPSTIEMSPRPVDETVKEVMVGIPRLLHIFVKLLHFQRSSLNSLVQSYLQMIQNVYPTQTQCTKALDFLCEVLYNVDTCAPTVLTDPFIECIA
jgi:tetratricopeptide (TPR) repeat protein